MDSMKISTKLSLGFFAITLTFFVLAAITLWQIELVSRAATRMDSETHLLNLAATWRANVQQNSARSLAVAYSDGTDMLEFFKGPIEELTRSTSETQKAVLALAQDDATRKRAAAVGEVRSTWVTIRDQANSLKAAGDGAGAKALVNSKLVPGTVDYIRVTQELVDGQLVNVRAARTLTSC